VLKKDRSGIVNKTDLIKMLPLFYQTHLQQQLTRAQFIVLSLLLALIQHHKQVSLEALADAFPLCIKFESRRRKLQRFLKLPQLTISHIWFPLVTYWLETYCPVSTVLYVAIDRTQWGRVNLMMVSLIWDKRAIPLYWVFLPKIGASNLSEQKTALLPVFPLLKGYKTVVLADREFCSVELGNWLREQRVYFCLRLKQNEFVQLKGKIWLRLSAVGLLPGVSLYFQGVKVTKSKGIGGFNVACKWQRKYQGWAAKEGWFILTNLPDFRSAITAYTKRFCIEQMFRDYKSGGYNLEATLVSESRLNTLILLIAIAYTSAIIQGGFIKRMGGQKYVCRVKEPKRLERRHSSFYVGLSGQNWVESIEKYGSEVAELMRLSPNKREYYQRGQRAVNLIRAAS
jgi:hypothetical protein